MTKALTAIALLRLADQGEIDLDATPAETLPEFRPAAPGIHFSAKETAMNTCVLEPTMSPDTDAGFDAAVALLLQEAETMCNCGEPHSSGKRCCCCCASSVFRPTDS